MKPHQYLATIVVVLIILAALWPLIAYATTSDEVSFYNPPTEHTALVAVLGPPEAPVRPVGRSSGSNSPHIPDSAVRAKIEAEFGAGHIMVSIAWAESQFIPTAQNPNSSAYSVFQILKGTYADYGCTYPRGVLENEIDCARRIYDRSGTVPWNASKHVWGQ